MSVSPCVIAKLLHKSYRKDNAFIMNTFTIYSDSCGELLAQLHVLLLDCII